MNISQHICRNGCCQHKLDRLTLRDTADLPGQGQLSLKQDERVFQRIDEGYQNRDVLTEGELEALRELRARPTDVINPYTVELDAKFPDRAHFYHRVGTMVTWYDRPKSPHHPLWHTYPYGSERQADGPDGGHPRRQRNGQRSGCS